MNKILLFMENVIFCNCKEKKKKKSYRHPLTHVPQYEASGFWTVVLQHYKLFWVLRCSVQFVPEIMNYCQACCAMIIQVDQFMKNSFFICRDCSTPLWGPTCLLLSSIHSVILVQWQRLLLVHMNKTNAHSKQTEMLDFDESPWMICTMSFKCVA